MTMIKSHATSSQNPPMALILLSAVLLKNLALTMTGMAGSLPLPSTLKYPALRQSITGSFFQPFAEAPA